MPGARAGRGTGSDAGQAGDAVRRWKLCPLPEGLVLGAPARLLPLLRSRILSVGGDGPGVIRLSVAPFAARLGAGERRERVRPGRVAPRARGGRPPRRTPSRQHPRRLDPAAERGRHRPPAPRRGRGPPQPDRRAQTGDPRAPAVATAGPLFVAPRRGMQALADGLVERLRAAGVGFCPVSVAALRRDQRCFVVEPTGERFDGVVLAVPAPVAFSLLGPCWTRTVRPRWRPWRSLRWRW